MSNLITENDIEQIAIELLQEQGYNYSYGPDLLDSEERQANDVVLEKVLQNAIFRINTDIPFDAQEEARKKVLRHENPDLFTQNEITHKYITEGIDVTFRNTQGEIRNDKVWLIDFNDISKNEFQAINQFTVIENNHNRRPDIILFVNGLPLVVIELKNPADEKADTKAAFNQIETYKKQISNLFVYNLFSIVSDYWFAKVGSISSPWSRFMEWKSKDGEHIIQVDERKENKLLSELPFLIEGLLNKATLLDFLKHFTVFERTKKETIKKIAAYHQYFAVNKAIQTTIKASDTEGDKRGGVVWHTQGSGKSLSMVFYTGKLVLSHAMNNPTIVVLTDRNDLDQQLFETFSNCNQLIRQTPKQAENRSGLRELLKVASGGVVFTTIQKFMPEEKGDTYPTLSERHNIVVVADEAHRSQYDFIDGFARHMRDALPNASFIGFTGTPIEKEDANTRSVFGDYVHVYDIQQAVEDGATVRIYYESRLAKINLDEVAQKVMDEKIEEVTENEELTEKQKHFAKWTSKEAIVGSKDRLEQVAKDLVLHFEARSKTQDGKGMIVAMSRRIAIALYNEIIKIRPDWHDSDDTKGIIKVIMTGSASDPLDWQEHIRNKPRRKSIGDRLKDPSDPLQLVIVRDMWLTGFDAPCLHTMYIDKPMNGHNLMQAIARINRVFKDKKGGLVVDYIGIAQDLKKAIATYTEEGGKGKPTFDLEEAVAKLQELYEVTVDMFSKFDYKKYFEIAIKDKLEFIRDAMDYILALEDGKNRFNQNVMRLSQAFGLCVPHPETLKIRDEVGFFQTVKSYIAKLSEKEKTKSNQEIETAIRQIVSEALISDEVIDVFQAAGLKRPDISILSNEFMDDIKNMKRKNLALELLKKLLNDELKRRGKTNITQSKKFSELLEEAVRRYQNGLITTAEAIQELADLIGDIKEADKRGEKLNLNNDELAFYDALHVSDLAEKIMGDDILQNIARELVDSLRNSISIDWNVKKSVQAGIRVRIKRLLRKYKYPPEDSPAAIEAIMEQTEAWSREWTKE
ncbi:type I restriction endonuclease subunit R [Lentimicrobium sp. L6]|uniref:type I restriction endonuclease subunit R n=1 Tax=Lentimicrobium sp. L6 TaxID=2735916 RepID=UPI001554FCB6|nr:type I restriction endonuclease subunit R [Lentimicrobium sp. L6]NPD86029.1 type I restriction endonuclease subunit R [Lentimicrobium sp. L6]